VSIKIHVLSSLQPFTNNQEVIEAKGRTVGECISQLIKQYPEIEKRLFDKNGKLLSYVGLYVNGEDIYPEDLVKPVKDGDELYILHIIGGG